jgi:hypothetical protein
MANAEHLALIKKGIKDANYAVDEALSPGDDRSGATGQIISRA